MWDSKGFKRTQPRKNSEIRSDMLRMKKFMDRNNGYGIGTLEQQELMEASSYGRTKEKIKLKNDDSFRDV